MTATTADIAGYYDGFRDRLVDDYRVRNRRVVAALEFAHEMLAGCDSVLDVGCGIGWTTAELERGERSMLGVDISATLIATADAMFGDRCTFEVADFTQGFYWSGFDGVLMVDVYEHFPAASRPTVHDNLRRTGARRIALTLPTPATQQHARDHGIALQPVDEDISDSDIFRLADDLDATVLANRTVSIWRPNDYRHVCIEAKR